MSLFTRSGSKWKQGHEKGAQPRVASRVGADAAESGERCYARTFMTMKLTIATTMTAPRIEGMTAMPPKLGPQAPNRP